MIKDKVATLGIKAIRAITGLQRQGYRDPGGYKVYSSLPNCRRPLNKRRRVHNPENQ